jgi:hypothetical protein
MLLCYKCSSRFVFCIFCFVKMMISYAERFLDSIIGYLICFGVLVPSNVLQYVFNVVHINIMIIAFVRLMFTISICFIFHYYFDQTLLIPFLQWVNMWKFLTSHVYSNDVMVLCTFQMCLPRFIGNDYFRLLPLPRLLQGVFQKQPTSFHIICSQDCSHYQKFHLTTISKI